MYMYVACGQQRRMEHTHRALERPKVSVHCYYLYYY